MDTLTRKAGHKRGISPWVPNQHGAWYMLITPALLGTLSSGLGLWTTVAVLLAWFLGYGAFFAFGLAARARAGERRKKYLRPVFVYGAISLVGIIAALALTPGLIEWVWWFAPLVGIAVVETLRGRPRSLLSGISTALASTLMLPVISSSDTAWWCAGFLAMYFVGTVPFVKTMIRERGNRTYLAGSLIYHVFAIFITVWIASHVALIAAVFMVLTMVAALYRAWAVPHSADSGKKWTPTMVGKVEIPQLLCAVIGIMFGLFL